jgi:hydrogenase maturation protease
MTKTLVIGLGNPILTDDGVGIYTARVVREVLPQDLDVDVLELSVGGLALMEAMIGYERVILIDALWTPDCQPGDVTEFNAGFLPDTLNTASSHDANLPTALRVGRNLGAPLPTDNNIQVVAVGIKDVLTFNEMPTPAVADAIPEAATRVLKLLGYTPANPLPSLHQIMTTGGYDDFS